MIGERLNYLRIRESLTLEQLGKILNLSDITLSNYENNKREPADNIKISIAKYFNVSVDYLIGLIDEPVSYKPKHIIKLPNNFPEKNMTILKSNIEFLTTYDNN